MHNYVLYCCFYYLYIIYFVISAKIIIYPSFAWKVYGKTTAGTFCNKTGYQALNHFVHTCGRNLSPWDWWIYNLLWNSMGSSCTKNLKIDWWKQQNHWRINKQTNSKIFHIVILFATIMHAFWPLFKQINISILIIIF